jgi:zinc protease
MTIKAIFSTIAIAAISTMATAQTTEFTVKGLKVIFKPSTKQTVSAVMFFKGGTGNYGQEQEGIESLTLSATTECGTSKYNKDDFKDMADKYGVNLGGSSSYDYGNISMSCVKPYFDKGWDLFAQAVTNPIFDEKELGMLQQKLISGLKEQEGDPDTKLSDMAMSTTFKGTRYAFRPEGKPETMEKFTKDAVAGYYNRTLLNVNRMILVVVGNLSIEDLKTKIEKAFGALPNNVVATMDAPRSFQVNANTLNSEDRKLATNYIMGVMGAPEATTPMFNAYRLAVDILSDKLFEEVRTKRNLSYAPYAYVSGGFRPFAAIYVSTTKPKDAVTVMVDEVKRLRNNGFKEIELRDAKNQFATSYFMKNESTGAIARSLGVAEIKGTWKNEDTFLDQINAVSLSQMQQVFKDYADGIKWNYLGDAALSDKTAFEMKTK